MLSLRLLLFVSSSLALGIEEAVPGQFPYIVSLKVKQQQLQSWAECDPS